MSHKTGVSARIVTNALRNMSERVLPIDVQKVEAATADTYRVVIHVPEVRSFTNKLNNAELAKAISNKFKGAVRYLPNSITATEAASLYTIFVRGNKPMMTEEVASTKNLVEVATNVFKDDTDCIWTVSEDAAGKKVLVRSDIEDFNIVLNAARSAQIVTASLEVATAETFSAGQVVAFYDLASENRSAGIAVDDKTVFVPETDNITPVHPRLVLAATDDRLNVSLTGVGSKKGILDYMRALYGKNTQFYSALKRLVDNNLSV